MSNSVATNVSTESIKKRFSSSLGSLEPAILQCLSEADREKIIARIWSKDPTVWKTDDAHTKIILNSLGWLDVIGLMISRADELIAFANIIHDSNEFDHVMVCGMGGSSLCPEVLRQSFGHQGSFPSLLVLDSTDPDTIAHFRDQIDIGRTLFVISSKSGTTIEPLAFYKYWFAEVAKIREDTGRHFIAITDPHTLMEQIAEDAKFRHVFLNPPDIGGRYSALSYFGLVPAVLMGVDVRVLLDRASATARAVDGEVIASQNVAAKLGAIISEAALAGRDKLTILADRRVESLGLWIEQLVAESTGKEGKGVVPIAGEAWPEVSAYGNDRVFVSIAFDDTDSTALERLKDLATAGHPVVRMRLRDGFDLAEQFFVWELATAFAGWRLRVNPFDQPNVQEAKDATGRILRSYAETRMLGEPEPLLSEGGLSIYVGNAVPASSMRDAIRTHIGQAEKGDYVALLNYFEELELTDDLVELLRRRLGEATGCATTSGYGPRFLHSTGQLHKGGASNGVFLQLTADDHVDFAVPGEDYSFSVLKQAQALGDFQALAARGRRVIRVHLGADVFGGLRKLIDLIA